MVDRLRLLPQDVASSLDLNHQKVLKELVSCG